LTKDLAHGKKFMCCDKITIADFAVAAIIFDLVYNDNLGGGKNYSDKGKALIESSPVLVAYIGRIK